MAPPYQNQVDPLGRLFFPGPGAPRGGLTGNRGVLHDSQGDIVRPFNNQRWIYCRLDYPHPSHPVMAPGRWTHLFFLDEAVALAAGHRPCALCLNPRYKAFQALWSGVNNPSPGAASPSAGVPSPAPASPSAAAIDSVLHRQRLTATRAKRAYLAPLDELPDACFVRLGGDPSPCLVIGTALYAWTPAGYRPPRPRPAGLVVEVLTPASTVAALAAGFRPAVHLSARPPAG